MNLTPFDRWLTGSGIRHYKETDGTVRNLEVGLRDNGRAVHSVTNPDAEDEANAALIARVPQLVLALQQILLSSELNGDDLEPETRRSIDAAWVVFNQALGRQANDRSLLNL